jgi:hypothetical protein
MSYLAAEVTLTSNGPSCASSDVGTGANPRRCLVVCVASSRATKPQGTFGSLLRSALRCPWPWPVSPVIERGVAGTLGRPSHSPAAHRHCWLGGAGLPADHGRPRPLAGRLRLTRRPALPGRVRQPGWFPTGQGRWLEARSTPIKPSATVSRLGACCSCSFRSCLSDRLAVGVAAWAEANDVVAGSAGHGLEHDPSWKTWNSSASTRTVISCPAQAVPRRNFWPATVTVPTLCTRRVTWPRPESRRRPPGPCPPP